MSYALFAIIAEFAVSYILKANEVESNIVLRSINHEALVHMQYQLPPPFTPKGWGGGVDIVLAPKSNGLISPFPSEACFTSVAECAISCICNA